MNATISTWFRIQFNRVVSSIAFLPAVTALGFLLLSWLMLSFDFSETGRELKAQWQWLRLKDASTARSVIGTIAAGVISLTVFSFSMVMIVLNQAASQLSNRVLGKLIGNRFQQLVLGFYIGTIVYAFFLLSTIRDIDSGIYVPAMSVYLLILFTILDIFLFIYFLHFITQSVKYETIIQRIHRQTRESLEKNCAQESQLLEDNHFTGGSEIKAAVSGIFQGFDRKYMLNLCEKEGLHLSFAVPTETFVLQGTTLLWVTGIDNLPTETVERVLAGIKMYKTETIYPNYFYGFRQLMEVAIKALSPGINDPGTAVISLYALADLLSYRARHSPEVYVKDSSGNVRISVKAKTYDEIFAVSILPIWDYGKNDRTVQHALYQTLRQLQAYSQSAVQQRLLHEVKTAVEKSVS